MGKNKKKKERDFAKVKLKVGKKLKKPTATDTNFKAKKVVLVDQLSASTNPVVSHRGLSLDDLCRQLGHYNINVRKDAIIGVKQLLTTHPELIPKHLRTLIPAIGRLIADERNDSSSHSQLRSLLSLLCTSPSRMMSSHFPLFMAHILRALTHLKMTVRIYAVNILITIMSAYPDLCAGNNDLYNAFIALLVGNRKPNKTKLLVDALRVFLNVYWTQDPPKHEGPLIEGTFSIEKREVTRIDLTPARDLFGLTMTEDKYKQSPINTPEGCRMALEAILPFVVNLVTDEKRQYMGDAMEFVDKLGKAVKRVRQEKVTPEFEASVKKSSENLFVLAKKGSLPAKLRQSVDGLRKTKV